MKNTAKIISSVIRVSANHHSENGMIASHEVTAILPGCRKAVKITTMPSANAVTMRPLFGYSGVACIAPTAWADLIQASPVVSCHFFPVELTASVKEWAKDDAMKFPTCPAITNLEGVAQSYLDSLRHDSLDMAEVFKAAK